MTSVTPANILATRYVPGSSRYKQSAVVYYDETKMITFETYKRRETVFLSNDQFAVIPGSMEFRPDLVSHRFYGFADYWWKIMEANQISDVMDFRAGVTIRLPFFTA